MVSSGGVGNAGCTWGARGSERETMGARVNAGLQLCGKRSVELRAGLWAAPGSWASEPNLHGAVLSPTPPARAGAAAGRDSKMKLWDVVAVCLVLLHTASAFPLPAGKRLPEAPAEDRSLGRRRAPFALTSDCKNRSLPPGPSSVDPRAPARTQACSHPGPVVKSVSLPTLGLSGKSAETLKGTPLPAAAQGSQVPFL